MLHANLDTTVDTPMRTLGLVRSSLYMFDFGLLERTMVGSVTTLRVHVVEAQRVI